jgi:hypothetical protein
MGLLSFLKPANITAVIFYERANNQFDVRIFKGKREKDKTNKEEWSFKGFGTVKPMPYLSIYPPHNIVIAYTNDGKSLWPCIMRISSKEIELEVAEQKPDGTYDMVKRKVIVPLTVLETISNDQRDFAIKQVNASELKYRANENMWGKYMPIILIAVTGIVLALVLMMTVGSVADVAKNLQTTAGIYQQAIDSLVHYAQGTLVNTTAVNVIPI